MAKILIWFIIIVALWVLLSDGGNDNDLNGSGGRFAM